MKKLDKYRYDKRCQRCLFHGKFGNIDCCDFYYMTGVMRPKVEPCIVFEPIDENAWKKLQQNKRRKGGEKIQNFDNCVERGLISKDVAEKAKKYENLDNKGYRKKRSKEELWNLLTQ